MLVGIAFEDDDVTLVELSRHRLGGNDKRTVAKLIGDQHDRTDDDNDSGDYIPLTENA
jgi:hypothetical protein